MGQVRFDYKAANTVLQASLYLEVITVILVKRAILFISGGALHRCIGRAHKNLTTILLMPYSEPLTMKQMDKIREALDCVNAL